MHILVANDDGIESTGLTMLADALRTLGNVWIVAPRTPQSAMGRALTLFKPINVIKKSDCCYAIDGTPSDCVNIALNRLLPQRPALVVSGINTGPNMGDDIPYSGTVAAAFEAAIRGIPAMAVSLACRRDFQFGPAADVALRLARTVLARGVPQGTFLNVNVPDTAGRPITDFAITVQGRCIYDDTTTEDVDPWG